MSKILILMSFDFNYNPNNNIITVSNEQSGIIADIRQGEVMVIQLRNTQQILNYEEILDYIKTFKS
tara:strand:- start:3648 stop:3845 length:198 start_codon:yes stop_codon:yes gene_type:complete